MTPEVTYALRDREQTAERLLTASANHSFDPLTEVDWAATLDPDRFAIAEHRVTLYGTPLWERMSHRQRVDLSRHEVASTAGVGIWFEVILMQLLLRYAYDQDMTSRHIQYAFTEIADECRHSTMFGRMIDALGCPAYRPGGFAHEQGRIIKTTGRGIQAFAAALIAEEILDVMQREMMADESLLPLTRQVSRIHVIEEARHVRYARDEVERRAPHLNRAELAYTRLIVARAAQVISRNLIHPDVYRNVGLDPREARAVALANPHRQRTLQEWGRKLVAFFEANGLIGGRENGPAAALWRSSGLVAADHRPVRG